jgi:hemoglobin
MSDGPDVTHRIEPGSITERVGIDTFFAIVDDFYARVEEDEVLRPVYPDNLEPGKTHLAQFLAQYFGAAGLYSSHRGHPRLRMRHAPFTVTPDGAARWASHMSAAIRAQNLDADSEAALLDYVTRFAPQMTNTFPDGPGGPPLPTTR